MNELQPLLRDQRKVDADHLRLLGILHFVGAGLSLLGLGLLLAHYALMHAVFTNPKMLELQKQGPPPAEIFTVLKWFYLAGAVWFGSSVILNAISGYGLLIRQGRTFSVAVAAINCLHIPLGTVLGVFTLVVLLRDSVREQYEAGTGARPLSS
jgi:hypothetical protein